MNENRELFIHFRENDPVMLTKIMNPDGTFLSKKITVATFIENFKRLNSSYSSGLLPCNDGCILIKKNENIHRYILRIPEKSRIIKYKDNYLDNMFELKIKTQATLFSITINNGKIAESDIYITGTEDWDLSDKLKTDCYEMALPNVYSSSQKICTGSVATPPITDNNVCFLNNIIDKFYYNSIFNHDLMPHIYLELLNAEDDDDEKKVYKDAIREKNKELGLKFDDDRDRAFVGFWLAYPDTLFPKKLLQKQKTVGDFIR
jgi:hypothetical protein